MNLDEGQKKKVASWIDEGMKLSDIQKRIIVEFGLTLTYMEVRFLVDDLKLVPKDPPPEPTPIIATGKGAPLAPPAPSSGLMPGDPKTAGAPGAVAPVPAPGPAGGALGGKVTVAVDTVARPGTMVSGSVTFSDGQKGIWYLDQHGQLGVAPEQKGYKPLPADVQAFQVELEKELSRHGY